MRSKDQILLEEAYMSVVKEDAQDAGADEALKKNLAYLIAMAGKAGKLTEGLAERNAPMIVDRLMEFIQDHCRKAYEKGLADGQDDGIGLTRALDAEYGD
jgi:hypothetical protein